MTASVFCGIQKIKMMDLDKYESKLMKIADDKVGVESAINEYGPGDVTLLDVDLYGPKLQRIRNKYELWCETVFLLISEIDDEFEGDRINFLETLLRNVRIRVKTNEKEVKTAVYRIMMDQKAGRVE